jgi:alpha 1,2-mannosyltransferase
LFPPRLVPHTPQLGLHFVLTVSHEGYGNATSISRLLGTSEPSPEKASKEVPEQYHWANDTTFVPGRRANATIVMLARNGDINGAAKSIKQMEDRFNKRFRYPYVFLNEEPFTDQFKECVALPRSHLFVTLTVVVIQRDRRRMSGLTDATVEFGLIPSEHWQQPDWIDETKATASREEMVKNNVIYGGKRALTAAEIMLYSLPFFQEACRTYKAFVLALVVDSRKDIGTCVASILA